jgi:hypothetical protein
MPPPGLVPPGAPPFPMLPGARPPFPPPSFLPQGASPPPGFIPPSTITTTPAALTFVPASSAPSVSASVTPSVPTPMTSAHPPELKLPNPTLSQSNAPFKKPTELKWADPNFSPVRLDLL